MIENQDLGKKAAGLWAAAKVQDGMLVGLGTGSTANYFIEHVAKRIKEDGLKIKAVSSSFSSTLLARKLMIPLIPIDEVSTLDIYVDGADEVAPDKSLIKGRGAAMVREKLLASACAEFIVVVDESKLVAKLGAKYPVPVEIVPFAYSYPLRRLQDLGGLCQIRQAIGKDGPVITDQGNLVVDVTFPASVDLCGIDGVLNQIPGVLGHGIFCGLAKKIIVGGENDARIID